MLHTSIHGEVAQIVVFLVFSELAGEIREDFERCRWFSLQNVSYNFMCSDPVVIRVKNSQRIPCMMHGIKGHDGRKGFSTERGV